MQSICPKSHSSQGRLKPDARRRLRFHLSPGNETRGALPLPWTQPCPRANPAAIAPPSCSALTCVALYVFLHQPRNARTRHAWRRRAAAVQSSGGREEAGAGHQGVCSCRNFQCLISLFCIKPQVPAPSLRTLGVTRFTFPPSGPRTSRAQSCLCCQGSGPRPHSAALACMSHDTCRRRRQCSCCFRAAVCST